MCTGFFLFSGIFRPSVVHIHLSIQCVPESFLWGYGCQFTTLTAHVRPVASGRRLGQLYRLTHDVDLNDIVCRNIDRMPHEKHHMFVVLCVNDTHETCGFVYFFYFEYQLGMKTCFWTSFECCNLKPCGTCNYHSLLNGQTNIYRVSHELRSLLRRVFLMLKYTDITQNTNVQSWTVTEIMAREVWNFDSFYTLTDYQIHIKTGRNMWFL